MLAKNEKRTVVRLTCIAYIIDIVSSQKTQAGQHQHTLSGSFLWLL